MIPRYSRKKIADIWSDQNKYQIWLDIEANAIEAMEILGQVPKGTAEHIFNNAKFDVNKILEIEEVTKHDVIAFLTNLADSIGESSRYVHKGMTSSDVLDTCLSKQLSMASDILLEDLTELLEALKEKSFNYKNTICLGRSHGIHAEPTTFGLKMARFYAEIKRCKERLEMAKKDISVCAISGAVGAMATIDPFIQEHVAKKMGLSQEIISSQVIPRDRHAFFFSVLGVVASSVENIAVEIRHLQRTEVLEVEEFFSKGQKGSSAMPHKRNPVLSENLTGLARIVRSSVTPALENVALWHERDISHSSVERMIAPDATVTLDFALNRLTGLIKNLIVYPENMKNNLNKLGGLVFSQRVLIALIDEAGISREDSYEIVQRNAMKAWREKLNFLDLLLKDEDVTRVISKEKLKEIFEINFYLKNVDKIFEGVFKA